VRKAMEFKARSIRLLAFEASEILVLSYRRTFTNIPSTDDSDDALHENYHLLSSPYPAGFSAIRANGSRSAIEEELYFITDRGRGSD
jgi:hypothetical protein